MRISNKGNIISYSNVVNSLIKRDGYQHCKMVGRGMATEKALEVMRDLKSRDPKLWVEHNFTTALNKRGEVVDEVHIMIMASRPQPNQSFSI